jgi:hypothetical protein
MEASKIILSNIQDVLTFREEKLIWIYRHPIKEQAFLMGLTEHTIKEMRWRISKKLGLRRFIQVGKLLENGTLVIQPPEGGYELRPKYDSGAIEKIHFSYSETRLLQAHNLSGKQQAQLLGVRVNYVYKLRQEIIKKLGIRRFKEVEPIIERILENQHNKEQKTRLICPHCRKLIDQENQRWK